MTEGDPNEEDVRTVAGSSDGSGRPHAIDIDDALLRRDVGSGLFGDAAPVVVGPYTIERRLGAGGMGVVYAAEDPRLGRTIALKLVLPGHARGEQRILAEARALAKLAHPNVVAIHEVGVDSDRVFVAMELVAGATVRDWLETPRDLPTIAGVFRQAARGLAAAHAEGIVHRDFKPDNVLIGADDGRVRVVDFGLALAASEPDVESDRTARTLDARLSVTGDLLGTPGYMAREQLEGQPIDARADVFAFSVSLYEALHGRLPYPKRSIAALLYALDEGPATLTWRRDLPRRLVRLLRAGLSPDPRDRPSSLEPFAEVLAHIESPPRRLGLAGVVLGLVGLGAAALAWSRPVPTPETVAVEADAATASDPDDEIYVCPPREPSPDVDCTELADRLLAGGLEDREARCAFRRACERPDPVCPEGTEWGGTIGCALPRCEADSFEAAESRCREGDASCCLHAGWQRIDLDVPANADERRARMTDEMSRACAAGDAFGCVSLERVARRQDPQSAFSARVTACGLGHVQSCRRIAVLEEDREGLEEDCVTSERPGCRGRKPPAVLLARLAACGTVRVEVPAIVGEEGAPEMAELFERAGVTVSAEDAAALDRAADRFRQHTRERLASILRDAGKVVDDADTLATLAARVDGVIDRASELRTAMQKVADARAGILPARPDAQDRIADRVWQAKAAYADDFAAAIEAELGDERAAELRRAAGGWPGSRVENYVDQCPPWD